MLRFLFTIMGSTYWEDSSGAVILLPPIWQSAQAVLAVAAAAFGCSRSLSK